MLHINYFTCSIWICQRFKLLQECNKREILGSNGTRNISFLWSNSAGRSTSQYEKLPFQKGTPIVKRLCYCLGERQREIKALLECKEVTWNNYACHEWTQQLSIVERAKSCSLQKMAQFKVIPPETGTNNRFLQRISKRVQLGAFSLLTELCHCTIMADLALRTHPVQGCRSSLPPYIILRYFLSPSLHISLNRLLNSNRMLLQKSSFLLHCRTMPHAAKVLCYSTNEPPLHFPLSPQLLSSVEHYWCGVLVCRLGHMTEDIFFCYDAKEAPGTTRQNMDNKI